MLTAPDYLTETLHVKISDECCFSKLSQPRKKRRRAWLTVHLAAWRSKVAFHICEVLHHWHCKQPREDRGGVRRDESTTRAADINTTPETELSRIFMCHSHTQRRCCVLRCPALCVCEAACLCWAWPHLKCSVVSSVTSLLLSKDKHNSRRGFGSSSANRHSPPYMHTTMCHTYCLCLSAEQHYIKNRCFEV